MIKIFIVTFNRPDYLHENLKSLFSSDANPDDYHVSIINNMDLVFRIDNEFKDRVTVHHNSLRPDWSCGHLARDWNAALTSGFGSLDRPLCDQVILVQDDCVWDKDWKVRLDKIHETYDFYAADWGDAFMSFLPDAVRKIGLFDERFSSIGFHEADYFLRAWLYHYEKSSVNDHRHRRPFNETELVADRYRTKYDGEPKATQYYDEIANPYWKEKWGDLRSTTWLMNEMDRNRIRPNHPEHSFYPWFI